MRVKLFTHDDLDGVSCSILAKLAFGNNVDVEYCNYDNINSKVKQFINNKEYNNYEFAYITDISVDEEVAELIENKCKNKIRLLDHHQTALWLNKYDWADVSENTILIHESNEDVIEEKTCGAYEFFMFLARNTQLEFTSKAEFDKYVSFVDIVRKYDTWLFKTKYNDETPKQWNDLFYILGRDRFVDRVIAELESGFEVFKLNNIDLWLLELEQSKIDRYIQSKNNEIIVKDIQGYNAGVVFAEQYHSELGNKLAELNPELDFVVVINLSKSVSYRSIGDFDVSKIAKVYGGGGHPNASGSQISTEIKEKIIDLVFS